MIFTDAVWTVLDVLACRIVMPGKLKVRIVAARDLPVMDRASELTDAFAEVETLC